MARCPRDPLATEDDRRRASSAENNLTEAEPQVVPRIVNIYIELAEVRAPERKPTMMRNWLGKPDEFLSAAASMLLDAAGGLGRGREG